MNPLFHPVGWRAFLVAALIFTLAWYAVVIPLLFRKKQEQAGHRPAEQEQETEAEEPENENLIGRNNLAEGVTELYAHELAFTGRETQQGLVPDALEELKSIFHILETENGTKQDFTRLFRLVRAKYRKLAGTPSQQALNEYIRENLPFSFSDRELDSLWHQS